MGGVEIVRGFKIICWGWIKGFFFRKSIEKSELSNLNSLVKIALYDLDFFRDILVL